MHTPTIRCRHQLIVPLLVLTASAHADIRLPAIIGEHMVLQQEARVPLWGWAEPGEPITVIPGWSDDTWTATADDSGRWRVAILTPTAGGPHKLRFVGQNTITLRDVLIGEVWLCSGQSNMEWSFQSGVNNAEAEVAAANYPQIRLFDVERTIGERPQDDCNDQWQACAPETVASFSAVGYFHGRELHRALNVPIGLIDSTWGGTVAEAWTSERTVRRFEPFAAELDRLGNLDRENDAVSAWWRKLAEADAAAGRDRWHAPDFDDTTWKTIAVPAHWTAPNLADFDGLVWLRTTVDVPADWENRDLVLELGPIDDMDTVWFNGVPVGGTEEMGHWNQPRRYELPGSAVRTGTNVLTVRVLDTQHGGGIHGDPAGLRLCSGEEDAGIPLAGAWRYQRGPALSELPPFPRTQSWYRNSPTALFNGMISPIAPFGIRGVVWYQGESNRRRPTQYAKLFPAMITDWRAYWGKADLPFYFVQIAPYAYRDTEDFAPALREAQRLTLNLPNTAMVVTLDVGDVNDIHPRDKLTVGRRLAACALANTYGRDDVPFSGPLYRTIERENGRLRVQFDHCDGGLIARGPLSGFEIAGPDGKFVPANAKIEGESVIVWNDGVADARAVRYAWHETASATLFNGAGLPASSFSSNDEWQSRLP